MADSLCDQSRRSSRWRATSPGIMHGMLFWALADRYSGQSPSPKEPTTDYHGIRPEVAFSSNGRSLKLGH
eukprot:scaffold228_cov312-Pinguiococcus_pyrenoidosus.AAC.54